MDTIAVAAPQTGFATSTSHRRGKFAKMRLLAIDDSEANVALLEAILTEHGYTRVKSITDSRLAIETYRAFEPDLILLDLMMPHVDGFSVLAEIRAEPGE